MPIHRIIGVFILFLLLAPVWAGAELYYWTDGEGVKHFSNEPPANRSDQVRKTDEYVQDEYYASVMEHENRHKDIAIEGAREIENELLKLNYSNEKYLKEVAKSRVRLIYKKVRVLQKQFDDETEHGAKTGVVLR